MTFERLKLRYKYLLDKKEINGDVRRACSLLNRIINAIAVIGEFALTITLSSVENMKQECDEMLINLSDKRDRLEDLLDEIKVSIKF
ncbi:hypothetical protein EXN48_14580 [Clostridium botulinum]|nr:hypothetical protein [Clostridium botulinum]NFC90745.1 hypothetical protein [Clostridium botulinum]NFC99630.1 hypothetical protein [Clostridium botulinum]NFD38475.1 hypothetical protein [Clostridium botulinum]NFD42142.1 hypothetical protein [Clostridium botulinum]